MFKRRALQESIKLENKYKEEQLTKKIEQFGSMYGYASNDVSPRQLELRADPWIFSAENLFKDNQISDQYQIFQTRALELVHKDMDNYQKMMLEKANA